MELIQFVLKPNAPEKLPVDSFFVIKNFENLEEYKNSFAQESVLKELMFSSQMQMLAEMKGISCAEAALDFDNKKFIALERELSDGRIVLINAKGGWQSIKKEDVQYYVNEI